MIKEDINNKSLRKSSWELKELKDRRTRMELGVIEATQKDYDGVNEHIKELENIPKLKNLIKKNSSLPILILKYDSSEDDGIFRCQFKIKLPDNVDDLDKKIFEVKKWVDTKIPSAREKCTINKEENVIILTIKGKGQDGRCRWCSSFRTALEEFLSENELAGITQDKVCVFEKW